jgi:CTP-dependent riboflavin kinase
MPLKSIVLSGRLVSGQGVARTFTRESWARAAFMKGVGIDPFPGTLNLVVDDGSERRQWIVARGKDGILMPAPDAKFCDGRLFCAKVTEPVSGKSAEGAVVVPMVPGYPEDQLELIATVGLREALGIADGAQLKVEVEI